jgi:sulfur carrier protein
MNQDRSEAGIVFVVNGEERSGAAGMTLSQLVQELGFGDRRIATEVNLKVIPRAEYDALEISDGDRIEIVSFVGGG